MSGEKPYIIPVIMGLLLLALAPVVLALDITSDLQISISANVESPGGSTPPPRGGGGGGGGGTLPPLPAQTSVTFAGRAFPLSRITILKDGQIAVTTIAGPDAKFYVALTGLASGNYLFSLYGQDNDSRRTSSFSFPIFVTSGVITNISDIFIAPTPPSPPSATPTKSPRTRPPSSTSMAKKSLSWASITPISNWTKRPHSPTFKN
jgi:hypothetical protein